MTEQVTPEATPVVEPEVVPATEPTPEATPVVEPEVVVEAEPKAAPKRARRAAAVEPEATEDLGVLTEITPGISFYIRG